MPVMRSAQGLVGLAASSYLVAGLAQGVDGFDTETLRLRGIDPQLASYLAQGARFTAGAHTVQLKVNGHPRGSVQARFGASGALCFDTELLDAAGLEADALTPDDCQRFIARYPDTEIELSPGTNAVALWVPAAAIVASPPAFGDFIEGGVAGLFNYDIQGAFSEFDQHSNRFWSANTEVGFNAGGWIVRSRQLSASSNGQRRNEHLDAYAQRTFAEQQAVLQLGQISLANPVLSGARIEGVQWSSEAALRQREGSRGLSGIAATRARVEVHQGGALIYATVVPPGPFELDAVPQLDNRRDVQLTLIEADGEPHTVTILSSSLLASLPASGFALGVGQVRQAHGLQQAPWVMSAGWSQALEGSGSISTGMLLTQGYQAYGNGLAGPAWSGARWQATLQASRVEHKERHGLQMRWGLQQALGERWSANLAYAQQTRDHRELNDTLAHGRTQLDLRSRVQYSQGVSWSHTRFGSLNGGYAESTSFNARRSGRAYINWGQQWGGASLSLNTEWQVMGPRGSGNALYLSASLPLGEGRRLRTTARRSATTDRFGLSVQEHVNERVNYQLGAERTRQDGLLDFSANLALLPGATQLDLGYTNHGRGGHSYNLGARGGVMAHAKGLTPSAYPLQDTFALLTVGEVSDAQVDTPAGKVWTDRGGRAVISQLSAYGHSNIEVNTQTLPRNVDLHQGAAQIRAGRGAVPSLRFDTQITRRALLTALDSAAQPLPRGALVLGEGGALVTLVQDNGLIFVPDVLNHQQLWVQIEGQDPCQLHFQLPDPADTDAYFESAAAVCRAS